MSKRDIIVIGASAGGVNALIELVKTLPADFQASIFIVLHLHPSTPSHLPKILSLKGPLKAVHPHDEQKIQRGFIYIAPPDHHLLLEKDRILVRKGPKENRFRPSIDALFRSAAYEYGSRVIGIILSGMLNDGTSGMWSIKRMGGVVMVQKPQDALYESMPLNVLEFVNVDYELPVKEMATILKDLIGQKAAETRELTAEQMELMGKEVVIAANDNAFELGILNMGKLTPFTCPECHGTLVSIQEGSTVRFRCHTGHAFSASTLLAGVTESVEEQLWGSLRALEEAAMLLEKIGNSFEEAGNHENAKQFLKKSKETRSRARTIHDLVMTQELLSEDLRLHKDLN